MEICRFCDKECKNSNSLRNHERLCKSNPNRQRSWLEDNYVSPDFRRRSNQFIKAKENGEHIEVTAVTRKKISDKAKLQRHTTKTKEKLSKIAKERGFGGHTSKRRLYFEKKNGEVVYLQSSYEIEFANLLEQLDMEWSRPLPLIWVDSNGVDHRYYPDFKIGNIYIDTKNDYLARIDLPKINAVREQNNVDIRIVTKNDITIDFINALET